MRGLPWHSPALLPQHVAQDKPAHGWKSSGLKFRATCSKCHCGSWGERREAQGNDPCPGWLQDLQERIFRFWVFI